MSEQARKEFERWMQHADGEILEELQRIEHDPEEIEKRFGHKQTFGTAGIRSVMAAGIANLNTYTVRQTARGLAAYLAGVRAKRAAPSAMTAVTTPAALPRSARRRWQSRACMCICMTAFARRRCSPLRCGTCIAARASSFPPATTRRSITASSATARTAAR